MTEEKKKDKWHTIRSRTYRRSMPYTGVDTSPEEIAKRTVNEKKATLARARASKSGAKQDNLELDAQSLLKANPWLPRLVDMAAKARLSLLNSQEPWAKDKNYGWAHRITSRELPEESPYFNLYVDEDSGLVNVEDADTDEAAMLAITDPKRYAELRKVFEDYVANQETNELVPMTREEAEKEGIPWYPTTNEYLNALLETKLGSDYREALYKAADMAGKRMLAEDLLSDAPTYTDNRLAKFYTADKETEPVLFEPINGITSTVGNALAPALSAVYFDPELREKTSTGGFIARGLTDAGLLAASFALPWLGASRGAMMLGRPLLGAMAGGTIGGAANYGTKRLTNQIYESATGHGTTEYPIDLADLAVEAGFGGIGGPLSTANRISGVTKLKELMLPANPSKVSGKDIKASIKFAKANNTAEKGRRAFVREPYDKYRVKFPNEGRLVQYAPEPKAKVTTLFGDIDAPLATDLPYGRLSFSNESGLKLGTGDLRNMVVKESPILTASGEKLSFPVKWAYGDDPDFLSKYVTGNSNYFADLMDGIGFDTGNLGKALKKSQRRGSVESGFFTGKTTALPGDVYASHLAHLSGKGYDDETKFAYKSLADLFRKKSKPVNIDPKSGNVTKASEQQLKAEAKASKKYSDRSDMNMVTEADKRHSFENNVPSLLKKVAAGLGSLTNNVVPWGSHWILDVDPFIYEDDNQEK